jgi:putative endonuclease
LKHYVYILLLANRQLYAGYTTDLERRIPEHEVGMVASTRHRRPVRLLHVERYELESDARRRERFLKTTEGKRLLRQQIRDVLAAHGVIDPKNGFREDRFDLAGELD